MQIVKKFDEQANYIFYVAIIIHLLIMCVEFGEWSVPYRGRLIQVAFLLCCVKILLTFYSKLEWLLMIALGVIGAVSYNFTGEKYVLYVVVLIFAAKAVDLKKVLKALLYCAGGTTVLIAVLSLLGIGGAAVDVRDFGRGMVESRSCFGFGHPNNFHGAVWLVTSIAVWLYKDKFNWRHYGIFTFLNIGLFVLTVSKAGFVATQIVIIGGLLYKYANKQVFDRIGTYIAGAIAYVAVIALTIAAVVICGWRGYGPILGIVDKLTTGRVSLAYKYARLSWWHIWSQGGIDNPVIDNGFAALGINLGYVVWGLFILFAAYLLYYSAKKKDGMFFILVMTSIFYTYMESSFVINYAYFLCNPLYLLAMDVICENKGASFADESITRVLKSNITRAVVFVLVLAFLLRSVSYIVRNSGDAKERFTGFYAEQYDSIDVIMIGASTVASSFIPAYMWDKYGFTSYPLATNSQRPKAIKYLIEEGLKYQDPDLILIEMRTFIASYEEQAQDEGHIREVVDNMKYSVNRVKAINALTEEFDDKYTFYFDIFKYHSNYGLLLKPSEWKKYDYSTKNELKGFELKNGKMKYREKGENRPSDVYCYTRKPIPQKQEEVLIDLLNYIQEKNFNVLFVVTPRDHDEDYEGNMCYMKDIVNEAGYDMIDINELFEEVGFDYRYDMDDGAHTNVWGAVKVSDYVGRYIKDNCLGILKHRESVQNDWDNAYSRFEEIYENTEADIK